MHWFDRAMASSTGARARRFSAARGAYVAAATAVQQEHRPRTSAEKAAARGWGVVTREGAAAAPATPSTRTARTSPTLHDVEGVQVLSPQPTYAELAGKPWPVGVVLVGSGNSSHTPYTRIGVTSREVMPTVYTGRDGGVTLTVPGVKVPTRSRPITWVIGHGEAVRAGKQPMMQPQGNNLDYVLYGDLWPERRGDADAVVEFVARQMERAIENAYKEGIAEEEAKTAKEAANAAAPWAGTVALKLTKQHRPGRKGARGVDHHIVQTVLEMLKARGVDASATSKGAWDGHVIFSAPTKAQQDKADLLFPRVMDEQVKPSAQYGYSRDEFSDYNRVTFGGIRVRADLVPEFSRILARKLLAAGFDLTAEGEAAAGEDALNAAENGAAAAKEREAAVQRMRLQRTAAAPVRNAKALPFTPTREISHTDLRRGDILISGYDTGTTYISVMPKTGAKESVNIAMCSTLNRVRMFQITSLSNRMHKTYGDVLNEIYPPRANAPSYRFTGTATPVTITVSIRAPDFTRANLHASDAHRNGVVSKGRAMVIGYLYALGYDLPADVRVCLLESYRSIRLIDDSVDGVTPRYFPPAANVRETYDHANAQRAKTGMPPVQPPADLLTEPAAAATVPRGSAPSRAAAPASPADAAGWRLHRVTPPKPGTEWWNLSGTTPDGEGRRYGWSQDAKRWARDQAPPDALMSLAWGAGFPQEADPTMAKIRKNPALPGGSVPLLRRRYLVREDEDGDATEGTLDEMYPDAFAEGPPDLDLIDIEVLDLLPGEEVDVGGGAAGRFWIERVR